MLPYALKSSNYYKLDTSIHLHNLKIALARFTCLSVFAFYRNFIVCLFCVFISINDPRIKATLTSHMDFQRYPMDVQTLRIQIAACKYNTLMPLLLNISYHPPPPPGGGLAGEDWNERDEVLIFEK